MHEFLYLNIIEDSHVQGIKWYQAEQDSTCLQGADGVLERWEMLTWKKMAQGALEIQRKGITERRIMESFVEEEKLELSIEKLDFAQEKREWGRKGTYQSEQSSVQRRGRERK